MKRVLTMIAQVFDVQGRMPRRRFWAVYLVWQPFALLLTWAFAPNTQDAYFYPKLYVLYAVMLIPIFCAGAQRLQDLGQPGQLILTPLVPFAILLFCIYGMFFLLVGPTVALVNLPDAGAQVLGAAVLGFAALYGFLFYLIFVPVVLIAGVATAMLASNLMGQCLLPSQEGPNRFGPNPHDGSRPRTAGE